MKGIFIFSILSLSFSQAFASNLCDKKILIKDKLDCISEQLTTLMSINEQTQNQQNSIKQLQSASQNAQILLQSQARLISDLKIGSENDAKKIFEMQSQIQLQEKQISKFSEAAPVGSVIAFMGYKDRYFTSSENGGHGSIIEGNNIPDGWLICDGRFVSINDYPKLYKAIGYIHQGLEPRKTTSSFQLPDLRGLFLRGENEDRNDMFADPGVYQRVDGNGVGSLQIDNLNLHKLIYSVRNSRKEMDSFNENKIFVKAPINPSIEDIKLYAGESRPKNISVYYLIKYK